MYVLHTQSCYWKFFVLQHIQKYSVSPGFAKQICNLIYSTLQRHLCLSSWSKLYNFGTDRVEDTAFFSSVCLFIRAHTCLEYRYLIMAAFILSIIPVSNLHAIIISIKFCAFSVFLFLSRVQFISWILPSLLEVSLYRSFLLAGFISPSSI